MDGQEQVSEPPQRYIVQLLRALLSVVSVSSFVSRFGLVWQFISVWRGGSARAWWAVQCLGALSPMRAQGTPLLVYCCLLLELGTPFLLHSALRGALILLLLTAAVMHIGMR